MAATELKEYSAGEGAFKNLQREEDNNNSEDDFAIDDDEPVLEANDHKPEAEDTPSLSPFSRYNGSEKSESTVNNTQQNDTTKDSSQETPLTSTLTSSNDTQISSTTNSPTNTTPPSSSSNTHQLEASTPTTASTQNTTTPTTTSTETPTATATPTPTPTTSTSTSTSTSTPTSTSTSTSTSIPNPTAQLRTSGLLSASGGVTAPGTPENERMVLSYNERIKMYEDVLQSDILEIPLLRELAWQGVPETKGLRSLYWKILLHYLPKNKALWESSLARDRKLYQDWVKELVIDPHSHNENHADHPLSLEQDSRWNAFFKDNEILGEIDKDVKRTFPHLHFFNQISPTGETIESPHYHTLKRILFIYAKLNPGIRYVQGMNELLGPIYYTFATDSDAAFRDHAEADAFFCFTNLMSEWRDNFCKTLDKSEIGVVGNMKRLNMLFKEQDPELWSDLEDKKMNPQFYSFRWITLLLSQEFELPDVLRLWDSLFADAQRFNFFYCFCCAMLICVRERILNGSFADNLKLLQSYPPIDFQVIFATALKVHENTYVPPPPRKKPDAPSSSSSHHSSSSSTPSPPPTVTSKLSLPNLFTKKSPANSPTVKPKEKAQEKEKEKEKDKNTFTLPLGLGKFQL